MRCLAVAGERRAERWWWLVVGAAIAIGSGLAVAAAPVDEFPREAQWIWSPQHEPGAVPLGAGYFRKTFQLRSPQEAHIVIAADDRYELYVNGRRVGAGESARRLDRYDIGSDVKAGSNLVAIRVDNEHGSTAALAARVLVREAGQGWTSFSTDSSWKSSLDVLPLWYMVHYNDRRWDDARAHGRLGETAPWDRQEHVAAEDSHRGTRFRIAEEFEVQRVVTGERTGSLIAMAFNEFGQLIVSRENGPLLLLYDHRRPESPARLDQMRVYCELVKNCQGILPLNGQVFVTGDGPEGLGLYRLADTNRDGLLDEAHCLLNFEGTPGEHGPHGVVLGPDGLLYVVLGNHVRPVPDYAPQSPLRHVYEGDLVQPRYEDPGGHARGVRAPGGVILRTDVEGQAVELVAGGLRNAYDLAFNAEGELFVHDSDMEQEMGTHWYRPTQLYHVVPGADFGWRSGWAKWPDYYVDGLGPIATTGRSSPAGAVFYNHVMFPARYHNALFSADWSEGRIWAIHLKRQGASYTADTEVFLEGQPMNVTALAVGPDGWLYFVTGGRGTRGGVYRVTWRGRVPDEVRQPGQGITRAIRQPQLQSSWARQLVAEQRRSIGADWNRLLAGVALSDSNPPAHRVRALDLMQLYGPSPDEQLLVQLAGVQSEAVRAKAAELMGLAASPATQAALVGLLEDSDRRVRRRACEALLRAGQEAPVARLLPLLASDHPPEALAARRLLERLPVERWRDVILTSENPRVFIQGGLALAAAEPTVEHSSAIIERKLEWMSGFISDGDFIDMLRLLQVALHRSDLEPDQLPELRDAIAREFPSGDLVINRELLPLLVWLDADAALPALLDYVDADIPPAEQLQAALHLRYLKSGWDSDQRLRLLESLERLAGSDAEGNGPLYVLQAAREVVRGLDAAERHAVLRRAERLPHAALGALAGMPERLDEQDLAMLEFLEHAIADHDGEPFRRLRVGIVAVLGRSGDRASMAHLREIWDRDPTRRSATAMAMAQFPLGDNWDYLLRSLPVLDANAAQEVLTQLAGIERRPDGPEPLRQALLLGLRWGEHVARPAARLAEHWTRHTPSESLADGDPSLAYWQDWYHGQYPDSPPARLPDDGQSKWQFDELLALLERPEALEGASISRGGEVFEKAQCASCHRFDGRGEPLGPDLTSVGRRFTRHEILEAILFPSHNISDQYASKVLITVDGRAYTGLVAPGGPGELVVLQSDGQQVTVAEDRVEEIVASNVSVMPAGLLDALTLEEIADLFAFLLRSDPSRVTRRTLSD